MIKRVCDICEHNPPTFKMNYKAEQLRRVDLGVSKWKKIELCNECLNKIIKAKELKPPKVTSAEKESEKE